MEHETLQTTPSAFTRAPVGRLCLVGDPFPEAKPGGATLQSSTSVPTKMPGGRLCIVADPTPDERPSEADVLDNVAHATKMPGTGRLCIVADPTPEAKPVGTASGVVTQVLRAAQRAAEATAAVADNLRGAVGSAAGGWSVTALDQLELGIVAR